MKNKTFTAGLDSIEKIQAFVKAGLAEENCDRKQLFHIDLIIEELAVNIVKYNSPEKGGKTITIEMNISDKQLNLVFYDNGIPFDPLQAEAPDIDIPVKNRNPGGLGIFFIKNLTQDISYKREKGFNRLSLKIDLNRP